MKILAIGQVENDQFIKEQIAKQTIQPDYTHFYIDPEPASGITERRIRIAENHSLLKEIAQQYDADYIWQLEGDAELQEDTLSQLLYDYEKLKHKKLAYVTGVQVGRHGIYALGAWHIAKDSNSFQSLDYRKQGLQKIDASGFYCLFARKDIWLKGKSYWDGQIWGPDVNWALSFNGYAIYADLDIHIGHKTKSGIIKVSDQSTCNVRFQKTDDKWDYKQLD